MKKSSLVFVLVFTLLVLAAPVVLAQDQPPAPTTATEALNQVPYWIAWLGILLGGLLGSAVVNALKKTTWLSKENREEVGRWMTQLVAIIASILSGLFVSYGSQYVMVYAAKIDALGLWGPIVAIISAIGAPVAAEGIACKNIPMLRNNLRLAGLSIT